MKNYQFVVYKYYHFEQRIFSVFRFLAHLVPEVFIFITIFIIIIKYYKPQLELLRCRKFFELSSTVFL